MIVNKTTRDLRAKEPANKANLAELESHVFIGVGWAGEVCKATKSRR
jgi:hypothetical protein